MQYVATRKVCGYKNYILNEGAMQTVDISFFLFVFFFLARIGNKKKGSKHHHWHTKSQAVF